MTLAELTIAGLAVYALFRFALGVGNVIARLLERIRGLETTLSGVEQRSARLSHTQEVAGSNPAPATTSGRPAAGGSLLSSSARGVAERQAAA